MKSWGIRPGEWMLLESWEQAAIIAYEREWDNLQACIIEESKG